MKLTPALGVPAFALAASRARATGLTAVLAVAATQARAQEAPARDTLQLGDVQARTLEADPRAAQFELLQRQSALRVQNVNAERLPSLSVEGQAQYQSDVARIPIALPGGVSVPTPPHDTYDARVAATQRLLDATIGARRAVEDAQSAQREAGLRVALHGLRQQANDAYFAALRAQSQIAELSAAITALDAQATVAAARVREGTALPSEELALRAEVLRRRQSRIEADAARIAALATLAELTNSPIPEDVTLALPDLSAEAAGARAALATIRARPEFQQFAASRELLQNQEAARRAQDRPRLSAYGRAGYGRPGLNPLNDAFDAYWLAGLQLQWSPWNWGTSSRDREILALERDRVSSDEAAFVEQLQRSVANDVATLDRLGAVLALDDEIIALRERIVRETQARFAESVVTSAELVDREAELLGARVARALHRVELAQARARFLTTLGIPVS